MNDLVKKIITDAKANSPEKETVIVKGGKVNASEHNVLIGNGVQEEDKELFFGPLSDKDKFLSFREDIRFPQLMSEIGVFPSATQARKNGWDKDIPSGWSMHKVGKRHICILKVL